MTKLIKLGYRLRAARKAAGFKTAKELLKKYKIPASTYSQYESGARSPDDESLKFYSKILDVNFDWLKSGKGLPYKQNNSSKKEQLEVELVTIHNPKISQHKLDVNALQKIITIALKNHNTKLTTRQIKEISESAADMYLKLKNTSKSSTTEKN